MKKFTSSLIFTAALGLGQIASAVSLSELTEDYDVFVSGDSNLGGARIHGSLATGNDLTITGRAGFNLDGNHSSAFSVVAGNKIDLKSNAQVLTNGGRGLIRSGDLTGQTVSGNRLNQSPFFLEIASGQTAASVTSDNGIDFSASFNALKDLSSKVAALAPTLSLPGGSDLIFDFQNLSGLQVLNLTAAQFNAFGQTNALGSLVSTARFIVNVDLSGFAGTLGQNTNQNVSDSLASGILWNFYGASDVTIKSKWVGSILAPEINLTDSFSNDIRGSVIASSFTKASGQVHGGSFDYEFPMEQVPDSGSTAALIGLGLAVVAFARRRLK